MSNLNQFKLSFLKLTEELVEQLDKLESLEDKKAAVAFLNGYNTELVQELAALAVASPEVAKLAKASLLKRRAIIEETLNDKR